MTIPKHSYGARLVNAHGLVARYARAWHSLNPADQRLAPEAVYVACESQTPIPGRLAALEVLHIRRTRLIVAVRFAAHFSGPSLEQAHVIFTAHAVRAADRWAWILAKADRALYRAGCGQANPAPSP